MCVFARVCIYVCKLSFLYVYYVNIFIDVIMDVFTRIDWHPSLNDLIDDEFISVDRLERESAMYNILRGTHIDPLKDLHKDNYQLINTEHINYVKQQAQKKSMKINKISKGSEVESIIEPERPACYQLQSQCPKENSYIPGILKKPFHFPRNSSLSAEQHALCLRVILKFSRSEKPAAPTTQELNELQTYLSLQSAITQEQDEYLQLAKQHWNGSNINIVRDDLINMKWCEKLKQSQKLHRYYDEAGTIAFTSQQAIHVTFNSTVLQTGTIPTLHLPQSFNRNKFNVNNPMIQKKYFYDGKLKEENYVNQDVNCENLAITHNIDLVISSSGLNCLATNLNPNHGGTWILPVVIKQCNSKNIIFIDKPLPSTAKNVMEKNTWIYKYILRTYLLRNDLEATIDSNEKNANLDAHVNLSNSFDIANKKSEYNAQYNVYTIGTCGSSQHELVKENIEKNYKILVRTKIDAIEKLENGMRACVKLVPKLEHQTALGAEAVTVEEAAKQWISLTFTPDTYLIRIRVDQPTSEYLQTERRTTLSINNELNRLYNVKGENILMLMNNIIEVMKQMAPGRYLLRHTPRNGAFANIYREAASPGRNSINLDDIYCEDIFRTIPHTPWPMLDKMISTPASKFFNRMPAMFYPKAMSTKYSKFKCGVKVMQLKKKSATKRKNKNKTKNSVELEKSNSIKSEEN